MTQREKIILLLLPVTAISFVYGWFFYRPLAKQLAMQTRLEQRLGQRDAETVRFRIQSLQKEVDIVRKEADNRVLEIERVEAQWKLPVKECADDTRLQRLLERLNAHQITLQRMQKEGTTSASGMETIPRLKLHLISTYPALLAFLKQNQEDQQGYIPVSVRMEAARRPGEATLWQLEMTP